MRWLSPCGTRFVLPQAPARLDAANPLLRGLVRCYQFGLAGLDATGRSTARWTGGTAIEPGRAGRGLRVSSSNVASSGESPRAHISAGLTIVWWAEKLGAIATNSDFLFGDCATSAGAYNWGLYESVSTGQLALYVHNGTTGVSTAGQAAWSATAGPQVWAGTYGDGDNNLRLYLGGHQLATAAQTGAVRAASGTAVRMGGWQAGTRNHRAYLGLVFNRRLSAAEVFTLSNSLPAVFEAERRIWVPVSAAAPPEADLTAAGTSAASFQAAKVIAVNLAVTGSSSVSFQSARLIAATLSAAGSASSAFQGSACAAGSFSAAGSSSASFEGEALTAGEGVNFGAAGTSTASFQAAQRIAARLDASGGATAVFQVGRIVAASLSITGGSTAAFESELGGPPPPVVRASLASRRQPLVPAGQRPAQLASSSRPPQASRTARRSS